MRPRLPRQTVAGLSECLVRCHPSASPTPRQALNEHRPLRVHRLNGADWWLMSAGGIIRVNFGIAVFVVVFFVIVVQGPWPRSLAERAKEGGVPGLGGREFEAVEGIHDPGEALPSKAGELAVLESADAALLDARQALELALRQRQTFATALDRAADQLEAASDSRVARPWIRVPAHSPTIRSGPLPALIPGVSRTSVMPTSDITTGDGRPAEVREAQGSGRSGLVDEDDGRRAQSQFRDSVPRMMTIDQVSA
jgi:hypothetical protein